MSARAHVGIVDHGKLIALGTIDELKRLVGGENVISVRVSEVPAGALDALRAVPGVDGVSSAADKQEAEGDEAEEQEADTTAIIEILSKDSSQMIGPVVTALTMARASGTKA